MARVRLFLGTVLGAALVLTLALPGCGSDSGGGAPHLGAGGGGGSAGAGADSGVGGTGATGTGLCLLNNCHSNQECDGCTFGRNTCDIKNNRCVACTSASDCKPGEQCTSFGICAPQDLQCPTDGSGMPTISCSNDAGCAACDPLHQTCSGGKCVACTSGNSQSCTGNQACGASGKCEDKCPANCTQDSDCAKCENGGVQAKACSNHVCAECSTQSACPTGLACTKGKCIKPCGSSGGAGADCQQDAECYGCGNSSSSGTGDAGAQTWQCKFPVNGGTHGTCKVPAAGCTDLAKAGAVLPPPFDSVTNTCSNDADCSGVSMDVNIGKLIRDLIGSDSINLGITKVKINDATLPFKMKACAAIELTDDTKCGLCVPCKEDKDCEPIKLDPLLGDLFKGDPLIQLASSFLLDYLFGKGNQHELHMQCQQVAGGYGICAPCANPLSACGAGSGPVGSGQCAHDKCTTGDALDPTCGICEAAVCATDIFCCLGGWDELCVAAVSSLCGTQCPGDPSCTAHTPCETGTAMTYDCSLCTLAVCDEQPSCCDTTSGTWDQTCVDLVHNNGNVKAYCGGACPGTKCSSPHDECTTGVNLDKTCSDCTNIVCTGDPYCCNATNGKWDAICVSETSKQPECPACPKPQP
jgi:hypothetical protein